MSSAALEQRELALFYQPQVELATGMITGVEAMLGWHHPTHGLLAPEVLRPIAERTGLIDGLTRYVMDGALRQQGQWQHEGHRWPVALNVSIRTLERERFAVDLEELLEKHGVPASALKLELAQPPAATDLAAAAGVVETLRRRGVRMTLDHVGGAHSSIASLRLLPLDEMKLDASLVAGIEDSSDDLAIVQTAIELARRLGLEVVADGVAAPELCAMLAEHGCQSGRDRGLDAAPVARPAHDLAGEARLHEQHRRSSRLSRSRRPSRRSSGPPGSMRSAGTARGRS